MGKIYVLRLGHRASRDKRITTHVGLVARAFGADGIILSGEFDESVIKSLEDVTARWGGPFEVRFEEDWLRLITNWKKKGHIVIHLTMYGINLPTIIKDIRVAYAKGAHLLVVVGAEKVPKVVYEIADYNVAVSNQPHSEVAALAVFLDWLFEGRELLKRFKNAKIQIVPTLHGKKIIVRDLT